jgi:sterol desaturase/sphingolipid hydroxylase (fatty acid hydroxylase superfamily)
LADVLRFLHGFPLLASVLRHSTWLVLLCVLFLPLEQIFAARRRKLLQKSVLSDLGFYFISGFVPHWLLLIPLSLTAWAAYHLVPWRVHAAVAAWPVWLSGLAAFIVADFGFYWGHRLVHQVPFLWRFHAVHHDPEQIYFLISARAHPIDNAVIRLCGLVPIYVLGLGAPESVKGTLVATLIMLVMTVWGFFIHANLRWRFGPLEWLLATPVFHHWHHTRSEFRDHNFASMLPVWDWIFRTHHLPAQFPAAYGIDETLPTSVIGQLLYPLTGPEQPIPTAEFSR